MNTWKYAYDDTTIRPGLLAEDDMEFVSGGNIASYAAQGFGVGGMIGTVVGAAAFGSVAGAGQFGTLGALMGGAFGFGWGVGTHLRRLIYHR